MGADDRDPGGRILTDEELAGANIPTHNPITHNGRVIGYAEIAFDVSTGEYVTTGTITDMEAAAELGITAGGPFSIATEITTEETP